MCENDMNKNHCPQNGKLHRTKYTHHNVESIKIIISVPWPNPWDE